MAFYWNLGSFVSKGLVADWSADSSTIGSHNALLMRKLSNGSLLFIY